MSVTPDTEVPVFQVKPKKKKSDPPPPPLPEPEETSQAAEDALFVTKESIPLWEAKWNKPALLEKYQSMGAREFDRGYRQRALAESELLFSQKSIDRALDRSITLPDHVSIGSYWYSFPRDAGVDLAIATADKAAAFFVIAGIMTTKDWHRWVMNINFSRGLSWGQQIGLISECHDRFMYEIVNVESNAYQESIIRFFQEEGAGGRVPVRGYHTGSLQKRDIEVGIPSMAVEFEQGRWHIPYGDARSRRQVEQLIEELRVYPTPGVHDDGIYATFFAREARHMNLIPKGRIIMLKV